MKRIRAVVCILLTFAVTCLPLFADEMDTKQAEIVRTGMTIAGAGAGLTAGIMMATSFSLDAIDTPMSDRFLLTIPVSAAGAAAGALAGHWVAEVVLKHQPSPLFSVVEGAGLGLVGGAFVGAATFTLNFLIAYAILEVPEGYWGRFNYTQTVGMAAVAGGFWGGFLGIVTGAAVLPIVSLLMDF